MRATDHRHGGNISKSGGKHGRRSVICSKNTFEINDKHMTVALGEAGLPPLFEMLRTEMLLSAIAKAYRHTLKPVIRDRALLLAICLYAVSILIVNPMGNFPLNDDWSYADTVRRLVNLHEWRPNGWTSMPLVTQSIWAVPFCLFDSCSFDVLRLSTLVAAASIFPATYFFLNSINKFSESRVFLIILLVFNPVMLELSFTFMTDVLFSLLLIVSCIFFVRSLDHPSAANIGLACLVSVVATLCRQLALCLPAAFLFVCLLKQRWNIRLLLQAAGPLVACGLTLFLFGFWMKQTGRLPAMYDVKSQKLIRIINYFPLLADNVNRNSVIALMYIGFFCLPALIRINIRINGILTSRVTFLVSHAIALVFLIWAAVEIYAYLGLMPIRGNILVEQGLGPLILHDQYILHINNVPKLAEIFWFFITILSCVGLYLIVFYFVFWTIDLSKRRTWLVARQDYIGLFLVISVLIYLSPLLIANFFERYLVSILPLVFGFLVLNKDNKPYRTGIRNIVSTVLIIGYITYGILGTHDYLSWNRARWQAIADLTASTGANVTDTDAGFEFNGANFDSNYIVTPGKSWWWVKDDKYLVTFGPVPGYDQINKYGYVNYLMPGIRYIYTLRKSE